MAESSFLPGEGVRVRTAMGAGRGRGTWAEGAWGDARGDPQTLWHSESLSEGLRQTPGARASDPAGPVALRLWLQTAMAKHAFEPESQSLLQNNSESLLDPKAFPMILLSELTR